MYKNPFFITSHHWHVFAHLYSMSFFEDITEFETNQYSVIGIGGGGGQSGL